MSLQRYVSKGLPIVAIQLNFGDNSNSPLFEYTKWGGTQVAKNGDWLALNGDDVYSIDKDSFAKTYVSLGNGLYKKNVTVYAEVAQEAGKIKTKEGFSDYEIGDYLVYNEENRGDGYRITPEKFNKLYQLEA